VWLQNGKIKNREIHKRLDTANS